MTTTGCRDCDRQTSGRCWRHSVTTIPVGHVQIIQPVEIVQPVVIPPPEPIWVPLPRD